MKLSPHFWLEEYLHSETAQEQHIVLQPHPLEVLQLRRHAETLLEPVRRRFGAVYLTSGYRSLVLNAAIGGAPDSDHLYAGAADIILGDVDVPLLEVARFVDGARLPYRQVIYEVRGDAEWVHLSMPRPGEAPRREALWSPRAGAWLPLRDAA